MNKKVTVSIIIPNWNGADLLKQHLPKVLEASRGAEVIVVDDTSNDDSVSFVRRHYPNIVVIEKSKHEGFASTANAGVKRAHGQIVVLLNTDVEPSKNFLSALLPHFQDETIFAVGCLDRSIEGDGVVLRGRGTAIWMKGLFIHSRGEVNKPDTAWVSLGSGAFRKSIWEKLNGLDPLYNPFYWEDIDISYRARKAGYRLLFEPKSVVAHFHQKGMILKTYSSKKIRTIAYRNQYIFIWKNLSDRHILADHILRTPIVLMKNLVSFEWEGICGWFFALFRLPQILIHRKRNSRLWVLPDQKIVPIG